MKILPSVSTLLTGLLLSGLSIAADMPPRSSGTGLAMIPAGTKNPNRDSITDTQLASLRNANAFQPFAGKPIPAEEKQLSLVALSSFLSSDGMCTMLPKGSIIYCPEELEAKCVKAPTGKLTPWQGFLASHGSWVRLVEVTEDQVQGKAKIPDETLKIYRESKMMVIATFQGSPITVLQFKPTSP